jgi:thiol-disulfide isomerase/thioredoxin
MRTLLTLLITATTLIINAQVEISGTLKNYNDSIFYINETGGFYNFTRVWRDNRVKVTVDKNQNFEVIIPEESIGTWYIKTEKGNQIFDLIKGKGLKLIADFSQANPLYAIGENADDFNYSAYLHDSTSKYYSDKNFREKVSNKNIDSVLFYRKEFSTFKMSRLNKYRSTHKMSDIYNNWLSSQYSYEPFERTSVENISYQDSLDDATISKIMEKGFNDEYAALNTTEYNDLIDFYVSSKIKKIGGNLTLNDRFNFVAENNILTGSTREVYLSRFMAWLIKAPDSIYTPLFTKYDKIVHNEKMKQSVISRRNDYVNPTASSSIGVDSSRANSIADIFKKYKGKVVYVDFWASWCVPCRAEMPNAANLKEKLKGKNIVFLYFGYNDKEKAWIKARNQLSIEGEHYLLDEKMIKEADELFGINGIPHYAIIDKEGRVISKRADRPSDAYQELLSLIEK